MVVHAVRIGCQVQEAFAGSPPAFRPSSLRSLISAFVPNVIQAMRRPGDMVGPGPLS